MTDITYYEKVLRIIREGGSPEAVATRIINLRRGAFAKRVSRPPSKTTTEIAALFPGQFLETKEMCRQAIHKRFNTARRMLEDEDAKWRIDKVEPGLIRITRLRHGEAYQRDVKSAKVYEIASLRVGESKIAEHIKSTRSTGALGTNHKISARRLLGNDSADWRLRSTNQGVRITRIA